jgi:rod shape-determining protein MreB
MIGRLPDGVSIRRAVEAGRVTDFEAARMLARHALDRAPAPRLARRRVVVTAAPVDCSTMQIRTLEQALLQVGAAEVVVVPTPVAAAFGGALPFTEGTDGMLVDVGAGTAEIAVFARGRMVDAATVPVGGDALDQAVTAWVRHEHQVALGPVAAEQLRIAADADDGASTATPLQTRGRHLGSGANRVVHVAAPEVRQACRPVLGELAGSIVRVLARCPEELRAQIAQRGVVLTGGLARSAWTGAYLRDAAGVPVRPVDAPDTSTAEGLARLALSPERARELAIRS